MRLDSLLDLRVCPRRAFFSGVLHDGIEPVRLSYAEMISRAVDIGVGKLLAGNSIAEARRNVAWWCADHFFHRGLRLDAPVTRVHEGLFSAQAGALAEILVAFWGTVRLPTLRSLYDVVSVQTTCTLGGATLRPLAVLRNRFSKRTLAFKLYLPGAITSPDLHTGALRETQYGIYDAIAASNLRALIERDTDEPLDGAAAVLVDVMYRGRTRESTYPNAARYLTVMHPWLNAVQHNPGDFVAWLEADGIQKRMDYIVHDTRDPQLSQFRDEPIEYPRSACVQALVALDAMIGEMRGRTLDWVDQSGETDNAIVARMARQNLRWEEPARLQHAFPQNFHACRLPVPCPYDVVCHTGSYPDKTSPWDEPITSGVYQRRDVRECAQPCNIAEACPRCRPYWDDMEARGYWGSDGWTDAALPIIESLAFGPWEQEHSV